MKKLNSEALDARLAELGLSHSAVAEKLGHSREAVSQWMLGKSFPRPEALLEIATMTGLAFEKLVVADAGPAMSYAYRTNRNTKPNAELRERAEDIAAALLRLKAFFSFDTSFALPLLPEPKNEYAYIDGVARELREEIGCPPEAPIQEQAIIKYFDRLRTVFEPVLWGPNGPNAFQVGFDDNAANFVYHNLQKRASDVKYWLIHEHAHILTPSLPEDEAERFAESLAGALLFPEEAAKAFYGRIARAPTKASIVVHVIQAASTYGISPITVWRRTSERAMARKESVPELDIFGAAANYDKTVKTLAEMLFGEDEPSIEKYIVDTRSWFGSRFFDGLGRYLKTQRKGPSIVQPALGISMSDAKGVWDYLAHS
jgi:transcriptional regulator with XRE-family HTH domain